MRRVPGLNLPHSSNGIYVPMETRTKRDDSNAFDCLLFSRFSSPFLRIFLLPQLREQFTRRNCKLKRPCLLCRWCGCLWGIR